MKALDAIVGTPVLEIKPVMADFLPGNTRQSRWATIVMSEYFTQ